MRQLVRVQLQLRSRAEYRRAIVRAGTLALLHHATSRVCSCGGLVAIRNASAAFRQPRSCPSWYANFSRSLVAAVSHILHVRSYARSRFLSSCMTACAALHAAHQPSHAMDVVISISSPTVMPNHRSKAALHCSIRCLISMRLCIQHVTSVCLMRFRHPAHRQTRAITAAPATRNPAARSRRGPRRTIRTSRGATC